MGPADSDVIPDFGPWRALYRGKYQLKTIQSTFKTRFFFVFPDPRMGGWDPRPPPKHT